MPEKLVELKTFLSTPPILTRAEPREPLRVYLSVGESTLAAVLVKEEKEGERPVYYISHTLKDAEMRYPRIEKLVFTLVIASMLGPNIGEGGLNTISHNNSFSF